MKVLRTVLSFAALSLAPLAHAQFGSGIVFDPTQSAHALQQITQASQLYTTAVATRDQIVNMYNLAHQMAQIPQNLASRYQAAWSQWTNLLSTPNTYGNTSALINALNFGTNAQQGYVGAYIQYQSYPSSAYSTLDQNAQSVVANQYATSEMNQAATTSTMATLGTIRSNSKAFSQKLSGLEADTSGDTTEQSESALLAKINSATLLQIHSQQDTNQLLAASIEQQMIAQKQQIDAQNRAINNSIYFQQNFPNVMQQTTGGLTQAIQSISLSPNGR